VTAPNTSGDLDTATGLYGLDAEPTAPCPVCEGSGRAYATRFAVIKGDCRECGGSGRVVRDE